MTKSPGKERGQPPTPLGGRGKDAVDADLSVVWGDCEEKFCEKIRDHLMGSESFGDANQGSSKPWLPSVTPTESGSRLCEQDANPLHASRPFYGGTMTEGN
ncbi:MAG: hypothetical protein K8R88_07740 [Armatimonadetes bacterium]|nr:hypothetical protein [Armatimonadota bacterium]